METMNIVEFEQEQDKKFGTAKLTRCNYAHEDYLFPPVAGLSFEVLPASSATETESIHMPELATLR
eukprot:6119453-Amphidinium_carterae.1